MMEKVRNMKLQSRILSGFGIVLFLLAAMSATVYFRLTGIESNSRNSGHYNEHYVFMLEKEIDHFRWYQDLRDIVLLGDHSKDVETDHTSCSLGSFLHGKEVEEIAKLDPEAAEIIEQMKQPHEKLHDSAIEILTLTEEGAEEEAVNILNTDTEQALDQTRQVMGTLHAHLEEGAHSSRQKLLESVADTS
ncbi:MAG: CZB domain-containing protein, partial [Desulfosalsimonas sp.]